MSLAQSGADWVAVAVLAADALAAEDVDGTEALEEAVDPERAGEALGVVTLCEPDPEVALVHPVSTAPATSATIVSCPPRRITGTSLPRIQTTPLTSSCRRPGVTAKIPPFPPTRIPFSIGGA
jgi:hypothetical protein